MDAQLFFLIHAIETVRGGVTKALYNRANILASQFEKAWQQGPPSSALILNTGHMM
ncbi:hypothetical protein WD019_06740 [Fictibacillus sp. Mic-4]|uniref:hypothetical protein n=1 Tax=Fictibacillus sp. Mic-4 TaxID=3132826 RepID=UPI003CE6B587